jgi:hypothetical protein
MEPQLEQWVDVTRRTKILYSYNLTFIPIRIPLSLVLSLILAPPSPVTQTPETEGISLARSPKLQNRKY